MDALQQFFAMGGYGGYVWPAYGIAVVVLVALLIDSLRNARHREAQLADLRKSRRGGGADE